MSNNNNDNQVNLQIIEFSNQSDFPVQFICTFYDANNSKISLNFKILDGILTKPLSDSPNIYESDDLESLKEANISLNQVYIFQKKPFSSLILSIFIDAFIEENSIL
jgi:hypothetical protein